MNTLLLLVVLLVPSVSWACNPMIALPCVEDTRHQYTAQDRQVDAAKAELFRQAAQRDALREMELQRGLRDIQRPIDREWMYLQTPHGTYTNMGHGYVVGPDGLYVPY
jgi:hypothetical protein